MAKEQLTPMMVQYMNTKDEYPDCILFYRLGDFYEMFFDDAIKASKVLEITLTGKDCGMKERAPMCGVPFHSASSYIAKLIDKGFKVAICEQTEDPKLAKGIVKREVIRVITPGTIVDEALLDDRNNNYLALVCMVNEKFGIAVSDVSTGEIYTTEVSSADMTMNEIARYEPREILLNSEAAKEISEEIELRFHITPDTNSDEFFSAPDMEGRILRQFNKQSLSELNIGGKTALIRAVGAMLGYMEHTQKTGLSYINTLTAYEVDMYMDIDLSTRRNLEITETMRDKARRGSLLWVLDKTKTSMGARLLKQWVEKPLVNPIEINKRLYSVKELTDNVMLRDELTMILSDTYDISRIISRLSLATANPRDLVALKATITKLPELEMALSAAASPILKGITKDFDILADVRELLDTALSDEPPINLKDGGVIKSGFNDEVDTLRSAMKDGKQWLASLESRERERTGISKLKVGYNKVFGYYIEVTKSNIKDVPETYIRRQTLANCERYITPELKELENTILGASERITVIEAKLFDEVRQSVVAQIKRLKRAANIIAVTDVLCSLAEVAYKNNYTMPEITEPGVLEITEGRHPVVEKMSRDSLFVPNDTRLNTDDDRVLIITGPNMAGKSTYMRQTALITLMAQIGSFVPAKSAKIGVVDRIFTRVGASDDISSGQSTFMLEMTEVSNILKNATKNSLIILDEIGRGTSTFDGLSIAWAVVEYIQSKKKLGAKTLFATHYHELIALEDKLGGVKNYSIAVKKRGDEITFLRKIVRGGTDDSYGIEVAALAGVPHEVILGAKRILKKIENDEISTAGKTEKKPAQESGQIGLADSAANEIAEELRRMDVTTLTPIEAMNTLYRLASMAKEIQ
ncbi:MAG: DNA mismatch repair protein MutS [Oscillospiraceae bacterium]|nr:DNA mismatch repair protein MutS [Oscillospiraceae bacterium]